MQENVIDLKKDRIKIAVGSDHQVEVYSDNQLERLQFYIQNQKKVSIRDKMIIQLLMFTGVRVSELCDIKRKNIDFLLSQIKIIGKGGKVREVPVKFEEIKRLENVSEAMKEELLKYFQEIAEGIVGETWQDYNLSEVGPILVIEDDDTIDVLDKYGLMQGNKNIPQVLPEFALKVRIGDIEMLKIIWVCNDSFGLSVYYPVGKFGQAFHQCISQYIIY